MCGLLSVLLLTPLSESLVSMPPRLGQPCNPIPSPTMRSQCSLEASSPSWEGVCYRVPTVVSWLGFFPLFFSVLEACGADGQDLSTEELWQKVLQEVTAGELQAPLHRLGALQAAWWLAASRLGSTAGLFRLLSHAEVTEYRQMLCSFQLPALEYLCRYKYPWVC